jgi:hypothetical protein
MQGAAGIGSHCLDVAIRSGFRAVINSYTQSAPPIAASTTTTANTLRITASRGARCPALPKSQPLQLLAQELIEEISSGGCGGAPGAEPRPCHVAGPAIWRLSARARSSSVGAGGDFADRHHVLHPVDLRVLGLPHDHHERAFRRLAGRGIDNAHP